MVDKLGSVKKLRWATLKRTTKGNWLVNCSRCSNHYYHRTRIMARSTLYWHNAGGCY